MSNQEEFTIMYGFRAYRFPEFGFDILSSPCKNGIQFSVIFEDPRDSLNNRHSYEAQLTKDSFKEQGYSLQDALKLLDKTYNEEIDCSIDYTEHINPARFILKIYERECFETLVFIEFQAKTYT